MIEAPRRDEGAHLQGTYIAPNRLVNYGQVAGLGLDGATPASRPLAPSELAGVIAPFNSFVYLLERGS